MRNKNNACLLEILFEDNGEWDFEKDPNHPLNKQQTQLQRPQGAQQPQKIGNGNNSVAQRVAGVQRERQAGDDRDTIRAHNNAPMEQFLTTCEVNMTNIENVASRTSQVQLPRQHFVAHLEILSNIDNVYRALDKLATTPAVKNTCQALQTNLNGAMKTLRMATKGVPQQTR